MVKYLKIKHQTSNIKHQTSNIKDQTSKIIKIPNRIHGFITATNSLELL